MYNKNLLEDKLSPIMVLSVVRVSKKIMNLVRFQKNKTL